MTRVAHAYRLPASEVAGWPHTDLVSAVASIVADGERCPHCGLTEEQTWWVEANIHRCPSCEDRDRRSKELHKAADASGMHVRLDTIGDRTEAMQFSSAARYTVEGARLRAHLRTLEHAVSGDDGLGGVSVPDQASGAL